jgi:thiamine biosynthesis lipoprotein
MSERIDDTDWRRRARPLLGTLVDIGARGSRDDATAAIDAAFDEVRAAQAGLSRFDADSDVGRFHGLPLGAELTLRPHAAAVFAAAQELRDASAGAFDISLATAPFGWRCEGDRLRKLHQDVRVDLGGIGKGYAVDCAVDILIARGCRAGWVNAGGDLRTFGDIEVPVVVRDETGGGARPFGWLRDGALATSHFAPASRSRIVGRAAWPARGQVTVAAPLCLWADALTKLAYLGGPASRALLGDYGAQAWWH